MSNSFSERVQILGFGRSDERFTSLESKGASFRAQLPGRFYGDMSQVMWRVVYRVGSDGKEWWLHWDQPMPSPVYHRGRLYRGPQEEEHFTLCPAREMRVTDLSFCDPFHLVSNTVASAAAGLKLNYAGTTNLAGVDYHLVEAWEVEPWGHLLRQWWIDARTLRPAEVAEFSAGGVSRTRFFYDAVNQPLARESFAVPDLKGISPDPPKFLDGVLDPTYPRRFVLIHDGADGRMGVGWRY